MATFALDAVAQQLLQLRVTTHLRDFCDQHPLHRARQVRPFEDVKAARSRSPTADRPTSAASSWPALATMTRP